MPARPGTDTCAGSEPAAEREVAAQQKIDRNARRALIGLVVLVGIAALLLLRSCVGMVTPSTIVADTRPVDEQIIDLNGEAIFVPAGTVGNKIGSWLNSGKTAANAFFVEEELFEPGSDTLVPEASARLEKFVKLLSSDEELEARLFVTKYEGSSDARMSDLAARRSNRLRVEMLDRGVPLKRVETAVTPLLVKAPENGPRPTIVIVLSRARP